METKQHTSEQLRVKEKIKREKLSWNKWNWKATYQIPCCSLVVQLCLTPCGPLDCSLPGYSVHGILQARILEWVAISFSRGSSQPRDQTCYSCIGRQILYHWGTREALYNYFSENLVISQYYLFVFILQFIHSVLSNSLWLHELQHTRFPCPSPTPRACSNSCPSSQGGHPIISASAISFSSWHQSFWTSGSFPMSQFFASGGQSIGASASALVLPMNIQDWFPLEFIGWIFLQSKGFSRVFSNTTVQKHQFFGSQLSLWSNSHIYAWLLEKP